jgi:putative acetyltransferase
MTGVGIRPFHPTDASPCARVAERAIREVNSRDYTPLQVETLVQKLRADKLLKRARRAQYFVHEEDGVPVGFCGWQYDSGISYEIPDFFVDPNYHGRGIGKQLLFTVVDAVRAIERNPASLLCANATLTAVPFYTAVGFTPEYDELKPLDNPADVPAIPMMRLLYH